MWAGLQLDCEHIFRLTLRVLLHTADGKSQHSMCSSACWVTVPTTAPPYDAAGPRKQRTEPVQMFMNTHSVTEANDATWLASASVRSRNTGRVQSERTEHRRNIYLYFHVFCIKKELSSAVSQRDKVDHRTSWTDLTWSGEPGEKIFTLCFRRNQTPAANQSPVFIYLNHSYLSAVIPTCFTVQLSLSPPPSCKYCSFALLLRLSPSLSPPIPPPSSLSSQSSSLARLHLVLSISSPRLSLFLS